MGAMWGFETETVTVLKRVEDGTDSLRNKKYRWVREDVDGVLVAPATSSGVGLARQDETRRSLTLHFPKGYGESLRGCMVVVRGETFSVVGDPHPYSDGNVPGPWSMPVDVEAVDG